MQKSNIEWTEFTSNPVKGECPVGCSYCYVKPFRSRYGWHSDIRFYSQELEAIRRRRKPTRIFMGSTIELFHEKTIQYMPEIIDSVRACPRHTFQFLTKQPQRLPEFSPFPENAWVGVTATNTKMFVDAMDSLYHVQAKVKYLSLEPLLEWQIKPDVLYGDFEAQQLDWLIIGACTGTKLEMGRLSKGWLDFLKRVKPYGNKWTLQPKIEWVREIVEAADKAGVKVFLKNNLEPLFLNEKGLYWEGFFGDKGLRQELPNG